MAFSNTFKKVFLMGTLNEWLGKLLAVILAFLVSFLAPITAFLYFTGFVVFVDLYTGIRAGYVRAKKAGVEPEGVSADKLRETIHKTKDYFIAILVSHGMQVVFFPTDAVPYITWTVAATIAATEVKSVLENIFVTTNTDLWGAIAEFFNKRVKSKQDEAK